ncbi:MAG: M48 family metalloprotease [Cyanobacteriota bacterium]
MPLKSILTVLFIILISTTAVAFAEDSVNNENKVDYTKTDEITSKYGFTLQEEKEIGFQSAIILAKRYGYYNDPKVNEYVNKVGKEIAQKVSNRPDIEYSFYVLDTPEINAFAVPGGFIFITKGALKILSNEAELAGILAHEIAHVELGHGLEAIASNPSVRDKVRILKVNLSEGKGFTQQSFKSLLTKEKDVTSGIVNSGQIKEPTQILFEDDGSLIIQSDK